MAEMAALARGEDPQQGLERSFKSVDTCAAEFEAETPYFYSGWERRAAHEVKRGDKPSVVILGAGPNRIGQGIEFDYCCVHAAMTVRESGRDAVMVNCNPETVSTDYDTSDRLYFEPLTLDDVLGVIELEQPEGVIVQFGGQTPLKLARGLADAGVRCWERRSSRSTWRRTAPASAACSTSWAAQPALRHRGLGGRGARGGRRGGLPAARPAELRAGGRAMEICYSREGLADYLGRGRTGMRAARSSSIASSRTRSRSTSTRSATARTPRSARSCSTSRRPGCTRATPPA